MIPRATYRLQFHKAFTFADAGRQAGYFAQLGVSHIYASPILTARAGSLHGYDVVDHSRINPELGGENGFRAMARALRAEGLGLIVDIVPNHMAVGKADNDWWLDLLANGPASRHAGTFDIDWNAPGLEGKVLAPFLNADPRAALESGKLKLVREAGRLAFAYYDHRFPLRPEDQSWSGQTVQELENLLARQHFVLAHWRDADARINWRRFFDITDLAAVRIAEPQVFEAVHTKIFALYAEGLIDGVRVDHVDGLADPRAYCRTLRARLEALRPGAAIYVEKILADGETLAADWLVNGTTGYDFLDEVSAVLHRDDGGALDALWQAVSGRGLNFEQEETLARHQILSAKFPGQLAAAVRVIAPVLDEPAAAVEPLLKEVLARLRCYRSYATGRAQTPGPGLFLATALARTGDEVCELRDPLQKLGAVFDRDDDDIEVVDSLRRFSQLSAPLAAKAVEDTAFYRYGRLVSRNDVGTNPRRHFLTVADFHARMQQRARDWPHAMLTTATHDHKRGEDARARLSALSCRPDLWRDFIQAAPNSSTLDPADVYFLHQTLFGSWPAQPDAAFAARIGVWCCKFLREGKLRSSWADPQANYERRFGEQAGALILDPAYAVYRRRLTDLLVQLAPRIRAASLAQLVLRNTVPGVPDLYQGCEFEDLSLVDPDNRRPVDFCIRARALAEARDEKQRVLNRLLITRREYPELWEKGDYQPIEADGCLAFRRVYQDRSLSVWVQIGNHGRDLLLEQAGTDILTGQHYPAGVSPQAAVFATYPVAVLSQQWE